MSTLEREPCWHDGASKPVDRYNDTLVRGLEQARSAQARISLLGFVRWQRRIIGNARLFVYGYDGKKG